MWDDTRLWFMIHLKPNVHRKISTCFIQTHLSKFECWNDRKFSWHILLCSLCGMYMATWILSYFSYWAPQIATMSRYNVSWLSTCILKVNSRPFLGHMSAKLSVVSCPFLASIPLDGFQLNALTGESVMYIYLYLDIYLPGHLAMILSQKLCNCTTRFAVSAAQRLQFWIDSLYA